MTMGCEISDDLQRRHEDARAELFEKLDDMSLTNVGPYMVDDVAEAIDKLIIMRIEMAQASI